MLAFEFPVSITLSSYTASSLRTLVVAPGLGPVAAVDHAAPPPPAGSRTIEKHPATSNVGTLTQSVRWYRNEQLSRRIYNGTENPV